MLETGLTVFLEIWYKLYGHLIYHRRFGTNQTGWQVEVGLFFWQILIESSCRVFGKTKYSKELIFNRLLVFCQVS